MAIKIDDNKLNDLRDYFLNGGSTEDTNVLEHLGCKNQSTVNAYLEALYSKFPEDFPAEVKDEEFIYLLRNDDNTVRELELVKNKNGTILFALKEPKELVTIIVRGKPLEVDLVKLRRLSPTAIEHGLPVSRLIELAEIAKG